MKGIIRTVRKMFGKHEIEYEYWVKLSEIQIIPQFKETPPGYVKMCNKMNYYKQTGKFQSPIRLMRNFTLIDGYSSYLIAKKQGLDKVPVYFVD